MIKNFVLKKTLRNHKFGKHKHNKKNVISKFENKKNTKKLSLFQKQEKNKQIQSGGDKNTKEKFEVKRLSDIDYSQFSLSKYMDTDIDWGNSPGKPPLDCCIL